MTVSAAAAGDSVHSGGGEDVRLDFTDCIIDSPHFRSTLRVRQSTFKHIGHHFRQLAKDATSVRDQQRKYAKAYNDLLCTMRNHAIPEGVDLTPDEEKAFRAIGYFVDMIQKQEDKMHAIQAKGLDDLVKYLQNYQAHEADEFKDMSKKFDKATEKYCQSQEKYLSIPTKKLESGSGSAGAAGGGGGGGWSSSSAAEEMDKTMANDTRHFHQISTDFVWKITELEEQCRLDYIEQVYYFTKTYLSSFIFGYLENLKTFQCYYPYMEEIIGSSREQLRISRDEAEQLRSKILKDPHLALDKRKDGQFDRQGYLWVLDKKKSLSGSISSTKYFCKYRCSDRRLEMMSYNQLYPSKAGSYESWTVKSCQRKAQRESDRQFLFDITLLSNNDKGSSTTVQITVQADCREDQRAWVEVMDGSEPIYEDRAVFMRKGLYELDEEGVLFIERLIQTIEARGGLEEVGLYRTVGGQRKVNHVLDQYLKSRNPAVLHDDNTEIKTLTSALKGYLKQLKDPLIPYSLYSKLIQASKDDQVDWIHQLLYQVPALNFRALHLIFAHLTRIVARSGLNKMTSANLATCIGSCILKSENDMLSSVMEIKFVSHVTDLIIIHFDKIFGSRPNRELKFESRAVARKKSNDMRLTESAAAAAVQREYRETELGSGNGGCGTSKAISQDSINSESSGGTAGGAQSRRSLVSTKQATNDSQFKRSSDFGGGGPGAAGDAAPFEDKNLCVRALYSCEPDHESELGFQAGQYITNVGVTDEPGWLRGTCNNLTGLFPANYVQIVDPMDCLAPRR